MHDLHDADCPCAVDWHCCFGKCYPVGEECPSDFDILDSWRPVSGDGDWAFGSAITVDDQGSVYVSGSAKASWDGIEGRPPLNRFLRPGITAMFVIKLDSVGVYQWHTFHGVLDGDITSIDRDGAGNLFVAGSTAASWDGPEGQPPLTPCSGSCTNTLFVVKLDANGRYLWHTFLNAVGSGALAVDDEGCPLIVGHSSEPWYGATGQAALQAHAGNGATNMVIIKLDAQGSYLWHTFYGGQGGQGHAVSADRQNNVYVTGGAVSDWGDALGQGPENDHSGVANIVVLKLNSQGHHLWHTFHGAPSGGETGLALAVGDEEQGGGLLVTGLSSACSWSGPAGQVSTSGTTHRQGVFVLELTREGAYREHSFYTAHGDPTKSAAVDGAGNIFVSGKNVLFENDPLGENRLRFSPKDHRRHQAVLKLNSAGDYQWHAVYGKKWVNAGGCMATDDNKNLYLK